MIIDCGQCAVRGDACTDCVVTFLTIAVRGAGTDAGTDAGTGVHTQAGTEEGTEEWAAPGPGLAADLDAAERGAIDVLARSGLVPPLRLRTG